MKKNNMEKLGSSRSSGLMIVAVMAIVAVLAPVAFTPIALGDAQKTSPSASEPASPSSVARSDEQTIIVNLAQEVLNAICNDDREAFEAAAVVQEKAENLWRQGKRMRSTFQSQMPKQMANEPLTMQVAESVVIVNIAAAKCVPVGWESQEYQILLFVRTKDGWQSTGLMKCSSKDPLETTVHSIFKEMGFDLSKQPTSLPSEKAPEFENDPDVLGLWKSVDFVREPSVFLPGHPVWKNDLSLKELRFLEGGRMPQSWMTWTKGMVYHAGDRTLSRYEIRKINGRPYMFFEWMSGDVVILGRKPFYYVLEKVDATETSQPASQSTGTDVRPNNKHSTDKTAEQAKQNEHSTWWSNQETGWIVVLLGLGHGLFGTLIACLARKNVPYGFIRGILALDLALGVICIVTGITAMVDSQPNFVYGPLFLIGFFACTLVVVSEFWLRHRYMEIELRKMRAMDAQ